jgi:hypothetical protein
MMRAIDARIELIKAVADNYNNGCLVRVTERHHPLKRLRGTSPLYRDYLYWDDETTAFEVNRDVPIFVEKIRPYVETAGDVGTVLLVVEGLGWASRWTFSKLCATRAPVGVNAARVAARGRAAPSRGGLIHLTNAEGKARIGSSGTLVGRRGIFAVPESVAGKSTAMKVARTGLMPGKTGTFVRIPKTATGLFRQPVPVGPYSAWKHFGGVRYAPPGSINMLTGAFTPGSALFGPGSLIYGPDVVFWGGVGAAGGIYWCGESQQGGE